METMSTSISMSRTMRKRGAKIQISSFRNMGLRAAYYLGLPLLIGGFKLYQHNGVSSNIVCGIESSLVGEAGTFLEVIGKKDKYSARFWVMSHVLVITYWSSNHSVGMP
jgi:hypothetical protein